MENYFSSFSCFINSCILPLSYQIKHLKNNIMKTNRFIYWNNKEYHFFNAVDEKDAYRIVVNNFDLSFEPNFFKIESETKTTFRVKASLLTLNLKKHFKINLVGEHIFDFLKNN